MSQGPGRKQMAPSKEGKKSKFNEGSVYKSMKRAKRMCQKMKKCPGSKNSGTGSCKELGLLERNSVSPIPLPAEREWE